MSHDETHVVLYGTVPSQIEREAEARRGRVEETIRVLDTRSPGGQGYLFQACLRGEYLILAYPYVGTTVGPTVIPNLSISSHQHPAEP